MSALESVLRVWRRDQFCFSNHVTGVFVATDSGKARVPQAIVCGPFQKLDSSNQDGFQPTADKHFRGDETLTPAAFSYVRQIGERASRGAERAQMREKNPPELRRHAGTDTRSVHELAPSVVSDQD
jgi:hypothetical protein